MKFLFPVLGLFLLAGCSTVERSMAGKIGCPQDEIRILNSDPGWGVVNTTWLAQCRGQKFVCSLRPGSGSINDIDDMNCSRMVEASNREYEMGDARPQSFEDFVKNSNNRTKK